ncbi:MAG: DUF3667 domain-containing protein [Ginsengibacter sp.]
MSHLKQRKENNCLNCNTKVVGRFCHHCGQENVEVKESAIEFIVHFVNDITHFDGKFFTTLKDLLFKPGFLSREYMNGRRQRYLNPIRMYLFTSFIFFLVFFAFVHFNELQMTSDEFTLKGKTMEQLEKMPYEEFDQFTAKLNNGKPMNRSDFNHYMDSAKSGRGIHFTKKNYRNEAQYDSLLKTGAVKDKWLQRKLVRKEIEFNAKFNHNMKQTVQALTDSITHHFPQMLFVSLPFVALLFKLLYIRHKEYYYVSHGIFTLHFYIFVFIVMLFSIGFSRLQTFPNWSWLSYVNGLLTLMIFFYLYKAMRNFYQQRRGKTILKYVLFLVSFIFLISFLFVIFIFISFFQI